MVGTVLLLASGEIVVITAGRGEDFYAATVLNAPAASSYQPGGYAIQISSADISNARIVPVNDAVSKVMRAESTPQLMTGKIKVDAVFDIDDTTWRITDIRGLAITAEGDGKTRQFRFGEIEHAMLISELRAKITKSIPS